MFNATLTASGSFISPWAFDDGSRLSLHSYVELASDVYPSPLTRCCQKFACAEGKVFNHFSRRLHSNPLTHHGRVSAWLPGGKALLYIGTIASGKSENLFPGSASTPRHAAKF